MAPPTCAACQEPITSGEAAAYFSERRALVHLRCEDRVGRPSDDPSTDGGEAAAPAPGQVPA